MLSSDPSAWLRSYFEKLTKNPNFRLLAPAHQFEQLVGAVGIDHPGQAARMMEWSPAAQVAAVGHLAMMIDQRASTTSVELWRVQKGKRELTCVAVYLPIGIDLRLLEGEGFRRTQLCRDASATHQLSDKWMIALQANGWSAVEREPRT